MLKVTILTGAQGSVLTIETAGWANRKKASAQSRREEVQNQTLLVVHTAAQLCSSDSILPRRSAERLDCMGVSSYRAQ